MDWLLQQFINGLALGFIYALVALGYTMVYGILRFINFAHSDVLMLGAFSAYFLAPALQKTGSPVSIVSAFLIVVLAALICAIIGMLIEFLAYRPLRQRPRLTVLITAIGVSLFIEFTGQHKAVFGANTKPFPQLLPESTVQLGNVSMQSNDIIISLVTMLLLAGLWLVIQRTRTGMAMRAVSFNEKAAALMGVNINRIISFTFALGSALAGAGGILFAMTYTKIEPLMGVQTGLKAFVAAVLGGIGNLPGAALGGLVLGVVETLAGGIQGLSVYRDGIAFAALILILLFRPAGLLGRAHIEKV